MVGCRCLSKPAGILLRWNCQFRLISLLRPFTCQAQKCQGVKISQVDTVKTGKKYQVRNLQSVCDLWEVKVNHRILRCQKTLFMSWFFLSYCEILHRSKQSQPGVSMAATKWFGMNRSSLHPWNTKSGINHDDTFAMVILLNLFNRTSSAPGASQEISLSKISFSSLRCSCPCSEVSPVRVLNKQRNS